MCDVYDGALCVAWDGGELLSSLESASFLREPLRSAGYDPVTLPVSELLEAGGGVRCLSLPLEEGEPAT